ncbi:hypothetical protein [Kitasatospora phosalacinea]|uniref:IrrE N-terminal-like domain-containing protein n=1 Tax=Kitasatospora phosalacinea TaxID=2065 RepID=A0ABW6GHB8_9ACTN
MRGESWLEFDTRCSNLLEALDLTGPLDVTGLCRAVADQRGRSLHLLPLPETAGPAAGVCGLWLSLGEADVVFYEAATSQVHRTHIILHELSHMLLDHNGLRGAELGAPLGLFPDLDPAMVDRLLARGRTDYSAAEEQQAELLATMIGNRGRHRPVAEEGASSLATGVLGRLGRLLGQGRRR